MTANTTDDAAKKRRPVGRPRGDGKPHLTRHRVFEVCAKLFAEHGYAGASIRMMANELDASPASLFNLFGSKDGLLNDLISYGAQGSLDFYKALEGADAPADVLLYKSIFEEVIAVTSADRDHAGLFYLPELRKPEFEAAQRVRASMVKHYRELIERGISEGTLQANIVQLAAEHVFQLTETSILAPYIGGDVSPVDQAKSTAGFCMNALLVNDDRLDEIAHAANEIPNKIELPTS